MLRKSLLLLVLCLAGISLAQLYSFNQCEADVQGILAGTLTIGDISNETIGRYIYQGHVTGLKDNFPRPQYLALTYQGKWPQLHKHTKSVQPNKVTKDARPSAATRSSSTQPRHH